MPIKVRHRGNFNNTEKFAKKMSKNDIFNVLDTAGRIGVDALMAATPTDSGVTSRLWGFETEEKDGKYAIHWTNDNILAGFSVVIGLQYGHGTGTGGYVVGRDFINPAMRPVFDAIGERVWKEVTNA